MSASDFWDYITGHAQAQASRDAANGIAQAGQQAQGIATEQYNKNSALFNPYVTGGSNAYSALGGQLNNGTFNVNHGDFSFDPNNIESNPGYQFQLQQGRKAMNQNAAATGNLLGGAQQKQLNKFGQGLANTYENTFFNQALQGNNQNYQQNAQQATNAYDRQSNYANMGLGAVQGQANLGQEYSKQLADLLTGVANAQGAGRIGAANAIGGQVNGFLSGLKDIGTTILGSGKKAATGA